MCFQDNFMERIVLYVTLSEHVSALLNVLLLLSHFSLIVHVPYLIYSDVLGVK